MKIQKRLVDSRKRTVGYLIGDTEFTKHEAAQLARKGKLDGVIAKKNKNGWFIAAKPSADRQMMRILTEVKSKKKK